MSYAKEYFGSGEIGQAENKSIGGDLQMRDWSRHDKLYRQLQSQSGHEDIPLREMSSTDVEMADMMLDWVPSRVELVLDVGAKDGYAAWRFSQAGYKAVAFDVDPAFVQKCMARGLETVLGDMHFMQFEDESFDLVYVSNVLEHSVMPILCIGELARVSKRWLLVRVPAYPSYVKMVSHWAVVPSEVWLNWFSALLLSVERFETLKYHEDCYLLLKRGHWLRASWDEQMNVMKAVRELNEKRGFVNESICQE